MMIDWGQDGSPPKFERWLLHSVFCDFRPYWRRGALALACMELFKNGTSLVIAHRLCAVLAADQVSVINHGRTVERDTYHELVERDGLSATLYGRQFLATADREELTAIGIEPTR